jgi:hypothetical protein
VCLQARSGSGNLLHHKEGYAAGVTVERISAFEGCAFHCLSPLFALAKLRTGRIPRNLSIRLPSSPLLWVRHCGAVDSSLTGSPAPAVEQKLNGERHELQLTSWRTEDRRRLEPQERVLEKTVSNTA